MEFKHVALLMTENCNAKCKMCCDSRGVVRGNTLSIPDIDFVLQNIKDVEQISTLGITGGEPMLYPGTVEHILNYDFGRKFYVTLKTNGFWGIDPDKAEDFICKNQKKISHISLSYDAFHKEFIPVSALKSIISIASKYGIHTDVVGCFLKDDVRPGDILNEFGETAYYTDFCYQPVIKTGSANCFPEEKLLKLLETDQIDIRCIAVSEPDILINSHLDVYPCCSQVIENTLLNFGNLRDHNLSEIISDIMHNQVMFTIYTKGFSPFIEFMKKHGIPYPSHLASPCELCEFLFRSDWFLRELDEHGFYSDLQS
ncbi:MAG: radical SAM protein [Clostridiales bacterium]|nr:radical SAM protein [Clostridiales bacterium]